MKKKHGKGKTVTAEKAHNYVSRGINSRGGPAKGGLNAVKPKAHKTASGRASGKERGVPHKR